MATQTPTQLHDLQVTLISAKHLKNVNWRTGPLHPYASLSILHDFPAHPHLLTPKSDPFLSTRPVWNHTLTLPLLNPPSQSTALSIVIHHALSHSPTPLDDPIVGTVTYPLSRLGPDSELLKLEVLRPSGRPQGKILVKIGLKDRVLAYSPHGSTRVPNYQNAPPFSQFYNSAPAAPPPQYNARDYRELSPPPPPPPPPPYGYYDQYGYYSHYHPPRTLHVFPGLGSGPTPLNYGPSSVPSAPCTVFSKPESSAPSGGSGEPSAPVDYSLPTQAYSRSGSELAGALGGLNVEEPGRDREAGSVHKVDYLNVRRWC